MRTNINVVSKIRTHSLSAQANKAYASNRAAFGTGDMNMLFCFVTPCRFAGTYKRFGLFEVA